MQSSFLMNKKKNLSFVEIRGCLLDSHITRMAELIVLLSALRVFSRKRFTAGVFAKPFRVLSQQKNTKTEYKYMFCFLNWYLLGMQKVSNHTHKTGYCYLLKGLFSKFPTSTPVLFTCESSSHKNIILKFTLH